LYGATIRIPAILVLADGRLNANTYPRKEKAGRPVGTPCFTAIRSLSLHLKPHLQRLQAR
jgi:hypothetical protein